jgi:hypothetical protein
MPRRSKYTPELADLIVNAVRDGLTYRDAALVAGVSEDALQYWFKRYPDFSERIARARAERSRLWLEKLRTLADQQRDWRAYADLLDRCAPEYRKRNQHEITGQDGGPIPIRFVIVDERAEPS